MAIAFKTGSLSSGGNYSVPPGDYKIKIVDAIETHSKAGDPMVKLKFAVVMDDGSDGPTFFEYLTLTSASAWKIDEFLAAANKHPGEGLDVELDADEMIGWEMEAKLSRKEYNGNLNNKVEKYITKLPF